MPKRGLRRRRPKNLRACSLGNSGGRSDPAHWCSRDNDAPLTQPNLRRPAMKTILASILALGLVANVASASETVGYGCGYGH